MGEAKRRQQQDPNFGKPPRPRLFLGRSPITQKHMVYLEFQGQEMGISPHYKEADAQYALSQCQKCVDSFPASHWQQPFDRAIDAFIRRLNERFDYPDDDEILGVLDPQSGLFDLQRATVQQAMADANMANIQAKGEKLFTAFPYWHPDAPSVSDAPPTDIDPDEPS